MCIRDRIQPGRTVAFIGSSGVGKSTLINKLLGTDLLKTGEVRESDHRGRHVTTRRELIVLPEGGCLIDTPGMRELQLWDVDQGLEEAFPEIDALARRCHFSDCRHRHEIKCAVRAAVEAGTLPRERYTNYLKMQDELKRLEAERSPQAAAERKRRDKILHRQIKQINKRRP